ncbi:hypothetical protein PGIGA_G00173040, partial [Pangasianodon gigas]|nr:hypothetical protein [Pangasianodon gigas]
FQSFEEGVNQILDLIFTHPTIHVSQQKSKFIRLSDIFPISNCPVGACVHFSLRFLFSADRSGTRRDRLLL